MQELSELLLTQEFTTGIGVGGKWFKFWHPIGLDSEGQQLTHDRPFFTHWHLTQRPVFIHMGNIWLEIVLGIDMPFPSIIIIIFIIIIIIITIIIIVIIIIIIQ